MEDVLEVYQRPYDPARPVVCLDETSRQLIEETRVPLPAQPGKAAKMDYEYRRNGVVDLFMMFEPLAGVRHVEVTDSRKREDFALCVKKLVDIDYPDCERVVLVMDHLNTHSVASLYTAFPPEEARRLADKLEIHYTPKHGSWMNMAEIEIGVLSRQCLSRHIPAREQIISEVTVWCNNRNLSHSSVSWQFTTADARIKLKSLYPVSRYSLI